MNVPVQPHTLALPSDYPYRDSLTLLAIRAARPP